MLLRARVSVSVAGLMLRCCWRSVFESLRERPLREVSSSSSSLDFGARLIDSSGGAAAAAAAGRAIAA